MLEGSNILNKNIIFDVTWEGVTNRITTAQSYSVEQKVIEIKGPILQSQGDKVLTAGIRLGLPIQL